MANCPNCGSQIQEKVNFCAHCGGEIAWEWVPGLMEGEPALTQAVTELAGEANFDQQPLPMPENIAAAISYVTIVPAVVFLYLEPFRRNRFVRFHALQHLLLFCVALGSAIAAAILWTVLDLIPFMRVLVFPFAGLISLAWLFLWLLLVVKAYHHEMFKLPWIGDYAEQWSRS